MLACCRYHLNHLDRHLDNRVSQHYAKLRKLAKAAGIESFGARIIQRTLTDIFSPGKGVRPHFDFDTDEDGNGVDLRLITTGNGTKSQFKIVANSLAKAARLRCEQATKE